MKHHEAMYTQYHPVHQTKCLPVCVTLQFTKLNVGQICHLYSVFIVMLTIMHCVFINLSFSRFYTSNEYIQLLICIACQILGKGFLIGMIVHLVVMLFVQWMTNFVMYPHILTALFAIEQFHTKPKECCGIRLRLTNIRLLFKCLKCTETYVWALKRLSPQVLKLWWLP